MNTRNKTPMMTRIIQSIPLRLAVFAMMLLGANAAHAILITFEPSSYTTTGGTGGNGNLAGQPGTGTAWGGSNNSGTTAEYNVTSGNGVGGSQAITSQVGITGTNFTSYSFAPTTSDLAGTFNASSSILDYSFALRLNAVPNASNTAVTRFRTGSELALRFEMLSTGRINMLNGNGAGGAGSAITLKTTTGGATDFTAAANTYFTVSGQVNYSTKTYTVLVNGIAQTIGNATASQNFGFFNNTASSATLNVFNLNSDSANWISTSYDNISYAVIPEPSSAALLGLSLGIIVFVTHRRKNTRSTLA